MSVINNINSKIVRETDNYILEDTGNTWIGSCKHCNYVIDRKYERLSRLRQRRSIWVHIAGHISGCERRNNNE